VSPLLQGSLGGLCPLYILAGDHEVLRDEIIYLAHRAADPQKYPIRKPLLERSERQQANAERFNKPTQVRELFLSLRPRSGVLIEIRSTCKFLTGCPM
jgi:acetyl esterase/lipase